MSPIAHIESLFPEKFGIPRQAGIVDTPARVVFEPDYRSPDAVRGLEGFDYIWLLWMFTNHTSDRASTNSPNKTEGVPSEGARMANTPSLTVRPPRLGGNERVGVFACRRSCCGVRIVL